MALIYLLFMMMCIIETDDPTSKNPWSSLPHTPPAGAWTSEANEGKANNNCVTDPPLMES